MRVTSFAVLIFGLFCSNIVYCQTDTLYVEGEVKDHIGNHLWYYETPEKDLSPDSIAVLFSQGKFIHCKPNRFNKGYSNNTFWFRLVLKNRTPDSQQLLWSFYRVGISVVLYRQDEGGSLYQTDNCSAETPPAKRSFNGRGINFPVLLFPNQNTTLYAKVQMTGVRNMLLPMDIKTTEQWFRENTAVTNSVSAYLGFFCFVCLFNAVMYLLFHEKIYLWQCAYVFFIGVFVASDFMMLDSLVPKSCFEAVTHFPKHLLGLIAAIFMLLIFQSFTSLPNIAPPLNKVHHVFIVFILITLCINLTLYPFYWLLPPAVYYNIDTILRIPVFAFYQVITPYMLISAIYLYPKVNGKVKTYFGSLFLMLLFISVYVLNHHSLLNVLIFKPNNIVVGLSAEIAIFTLLTVYRFVEERTEKITLLSEQLQLQQKLTSEVVAAQETERKRIAADLHDGLAGLLTGLRMNVNKQLNYFITEKKEAEITSFLKEIQSKIDTSIDDVRTISHNLMPKDFEENKLTDIITTHLNNTASFSAIKFEFFADQKADNLPLHYQISIYRILTELINNILRHSSAKNATIQLIAFEDIIQLMVEDDGKGFDPQVNANGLGLKNIRSRVNLLQGNMTIDSGKLNTTFIIEIPVVYGI